jgi:ketosteroid isomerase-like protein
MRNYLLSTIAVLILVSLIGSSGKAKASNEEDKQDILRLEELWNDAHMQGDAESLDALWSDDLTVIVPRMQVMTKSDSLAFLRSGRMKFQRYETSDMKVHIYGDAAVVTGRLLRSRTINNSEVLDDWRFTKVYVRSSQKWRVVAWQASESAPQ